ncbi:MAG: germination protein YpeB [Bacillota bacterium]
MHLRDFFTRRKNFLLGVGLALVIGLGVLWVTQANSRAFAMENALEASYQNAFFSLLENTENLDVLLGKAQVTNSDTHNIITLTTAWHEAETGRNNLGNMPLGMINMMRSHQFMTQLGDFCYSLAEKLADKEKLSESDMETIKDLQVEVRKIHMELRDLMGIAQDKDIRLGSLARPRQALRLTPDSEAVVDGFARMDERLRDEVPTLTYDGPFSDHVVNRKPRGLTGPEVSQREAEEIAVEFIKKENPEADYRAETTELSSGNIPAYNILLQRQGQAQADTALGISRKGGHIVWMLDLNENPQERRVSIEEALETAEDLVNKLDLGEFIKIGHLAEGNEVVVNFALLEDDIIIYPDMVQVTVSLDSGNIMGYDAQKFLTSHTKRDIPKPKLTEDEAREKVNGDLKVEGVRLALIPLSNLDEKLCYEVKGNLGKDTYFVYINAQTGQEEKVLLIIKTKDGTRSI